MYNKAFRANMYTNRAHIPQTESERDGHNSTLTDSDTRNAAQKTGNT